MQTQNNKVSIKLDLKSKSILAAQNEHTQKNVGWFVESKNVGWYTENAPVKL